MRKTKCLEKPYISGRSSLVCTAVLKIRTWPGLVNSCVYYAHQTHTIYQVLPYSVDFKAPRELWNPLCQTVLSKYSFIWNKGRVKIRTDLMLERNFDVGPVNIFPFFYTDIVFVQDSVTPIPRTLWSPMLKMINPSRSWVISTDRVGRTIIRQLITGSGRIWRGRLQVIQLRHSRHLAVTFIKRIHKDTS